MKYITSKQLQRLGACYSQYSQFRKTFGLRAAVTEANALKAASWVDWAWLAMHALTSSQLAAYEEAEAPARKAYDEAVAPAWKAYYEAVASARKAYYEAVASARKAYDEAQASAWKVYNEAVASARKAYNEAIAPARKVYNEAIALSFVKAYSHE
jgi:hypothetical protein